MTDHQDRPDQTNPADQAANDARDGAEVQQAQDRAGIAGEPQPTDTADEQEPEAPASA